jgi:aminotransferase
MREAAEQHRVSLAAQRFLVREFEDEGLPSPTLAAHRMKELGAKLKGVISLSAGGQIARLSPPVVLDAARKAIEDGVVHTASATGLKEFRQAVAAKLQRDNGFVVDPDTEVLATIGCQLPIFGTLLTLIDPGDEVLIMEPEYASIAPVIRMVGGAPVSVPYEEGLDEWRFHARELERRVTAKSKLFMFSNGGNPTGVLFTREELQAIARIVQDHDLLVFADEEYEYITFDGASHVSIASLPGMAERTISAYSFSKTFSMSGFRIGYMAASAWIIDYMSDVIRFAIQSCPAISQKAALPLLQNPRGPWLDETLRELRDKRDYAVDRLNRMPGVKCPTPRGCYFLLPDIRALGLSSLEFAERLLTEERVSVIPGITFGRLGEGHVRVSACVGWDGLREGLDRFERFVRATATAQASAARSVSQGA